MYILFKMVSAVILFYGYFHFASPVHAVLPDKQDSDKRMRSFTPTNSNGEGGSSKLTKRSPILSFEEQLLALQKDERPTFAWLNAQKLTANTREQSATSKLQDLQHLYQRLLDAKSHREVCIQEAIEAQKSHTASLLRYQKQEKLLQLLSTAKQTATQAEIHSTQLQYTNHLTELHIQYTQREVELNRMSRRLINAHAQEEELRKQHIEDSSQVTQLKETIRRARLYKDNVDLTQAHFNRALHRYVTDIPFRKVNYHADTNSTVFTEICSVVANNNRDENISLSIAEALAKRVKERAQERYDHVNAQVQKLKKSEETESKLAEAQGEQVQWLQELKEATFYHTIQSTNSKIFDSEPTDALRPFPYLDALSGFL